LLKRVIFFLAFCLLAFNCSGFCDENTTQDSRAVKKISLKEAIELALEKNLDYKSVKLDIPIAKNLVKEANRLPNPTLDTFQNFGPSGKGNPQQIGATVQYEIMKRSARKRLAQSNLALAENNVGFARFSMKMNIREAYVQLLASKTILKYLQEQQELLENLYKVAKKRVEAGSAPEMDLIEAGIALNQMVVQINSAKADVKTALYDFNMVINPQNNNSPDDEVLYDTSDELLVNNFGFIDIKIPALDEKLPPFNNISQRTLANRLDVKIAQKELEVAQKNLTVVARQRIPDIALLGGYGYQDRKQSDSGEFLNGGFLGASIYNIPLFYNYKPEINNAKLEIEKAELNLQSVQNKALNSLNGSYARFVNAKVNLNYYNEKLVKESQELIRISQKSYEVGKFNLISLIVMQQSYRSIVTGYAYAMVDYYNSWIDFLREVNVEEFELFE